MTSNALIQQLLKAEEEAELIVNKAKENRVKMMKDARFSAEEELKVFRSKEDERFKVEFEQRLGQDDSLTTELASKTKSDIEAIKGDYVAHRDEVLLFMREKVLNVGVSIEERKIAVLKGFEARGASP